MDSLINQARVLAGQPQTPIVSISKRIAYVVSHGQSYISNGYAIRTQAIAQALNQQGFETLCFVRPGRPWELNAGQQGGVAPEMLVKGVRYIHSRWPRDAGPKEERQRLEASVERFLELFRVYRPEAVLVASNYVVGLPAWIAAKRLGLPFYNEVRGVGELFQEARESDDAGMLESKHETERDIFVAKQALKVFTLNQLTKEELGRHGVDTGSAVIVSNGVKGAPRADVRLLVQALQGESIVDDQAEETANGLKAQANRIVSPILEAPQSSPMELTDTLQWQTISLKPGDRVTIKAAVNYYVKKGPRDRKAVMVINAVGRNGEMLDVACGKLAKSKHLMGYFKYVPCSKGALIDLHTFKVSDKVVQIKVGLSRFHAAIGDRIVVERFAINIKPHSSAPTFVPPSAKAVEISTLGWPEYPDNGKPYVIGIMDEFTTGCFEQELNLIQPRPDNWYALAEKYKPSLFFIESAWKGNFGSWQYRVADYANKPGPEIAHICQYAKEKGIPTLFWNKEDPVHHQKFMCSAKLTDHIFTTDANMCDSYRQHTGNNNVHALPFAAQPALHRPAPLAGRIRRSCFAGSWYGNRHAKRGGAMRWLLQAANRHGLDIYDRNHGTGVFPFPEEYQTGIKGSLPYKELCEEYSRYRVFLNVNSVTESPTMFSRRVFELMACGTPIVSTYARGIEELFESDAVWLVNSEQEADEAVHTLLTDDAEWRRRSLSGIREVFSRHTYAHRLNDIFTKMGMSERIPTEPPLLLLAKAHNPDELEALLRTVDRQAYPNFTLLVETDGATLPSGTPSHVEFVKQGHLTNNALALKSHGFKAIGWLSPQLEYGRDYVTDLANAISYQPSADGWAKAIEKDAFVFGRTTRLAAALWQPDVFLTKWLHVKGDQPVQEETLFVIDSDEIQLVPGRQYVIGEA